jgi:hypothetical protein
MAPPLKILRGFAGDMTYQTQFYDVYRAQRSHQRVYARL